MDKVYERINWENEPSILTPLNATNLNKVDYAVDQLDNRIIEMDTIKTDKADSFLLFSDISYDEKTGKFTFTRMNGTKVVIDTLLEKVVTNFRYDPETQQLVITTPEGESRVDMSALITQYEFEDSAAIKFDVVAGKVVASLIAGGVKAENLQPNFLADCQTAQQSAITSANRAETQAQRSELAADRADAAAGKATNDFVQSELKTLTKSKEGGIVIEKMYGGVKQETLQGFNHIKYPYYNGTSYTVNGITFTVNEEDGTITANGTATANAPYTCVARAYSEWYLKPSLYYLTGCPEDGGSSKYRLSLQGTSASGSAENIAIDYGDGVEANIDEDSSLRPKQIQIIINSGQTVNNLVFKPMLMDLYGEYPMLDYYEKPSNGKGMPSYEYPSEIENVQVGIKSENKNLIPYPYYRTSGYSSNGITYTINADGSVTANGTATANSTFFITAGRTTPSLFLKAGTYRMSGSPDNSGDYYIEAYQSNASGAFASLKKDIVGNGIFTYTSDQATRGIALQIAVYSGKTLKNVTFKPMLTEVAKDGSYPTEFETSKSTEANTDIQLRAIEVTLYDDASLYPVTYATEDEQGMWDEFFVADELRFENDKFYILRRTKEFDLRDYQTAIIRSSGNDGEYTNCFRWTLDTYSRIKNQSVRGYTNINILRKGGGSTELKKGFGFLNINSSGAILLYLSLPKTVTTVEEARAYSLEHNIKLLTFADSEYTEEINDEDAAKLLGLKSWDEVTRITQESEMKVPLTIGYGSSNGMAQAIRGKNLGLIDELNANKTIGDKWSGTKTYAAGDFVIYDNKLWKCKVQNVGQIPSEGNYWTASSIANEINSLIKHDTITGTTTAAGYLNTNYNYDERIIISSYCTDRNGYSAQPTKLNTGKLAFLVTYVKTEDADNKYVIPMDTKSATIEYCYIEK